MRERGGKKTAGRPEGKRNRPGGSGAAIFCLSLCLLLLLAALLSALPFANRQAGARMESGLGRLAAQTSGAAPSGAPSGSPSEPDAGPGADDLAKVDECWRPLLLRLQADGMYGADVAHWFAALPESYSPKPMGVKVSVLFKKRFIPPYFPYFNKPVQPLDVYAGVVNKSNIRRCYDFLQEHGEIFQKAEEKYFVPKEVLVSLLMVETRLGNFTGSEKAFWSLACMASAVEPASIGSYLEKLPVTETHESWLNDILLARSEWAYAELKALILYCRLHEHDPLQIKGSIYGAIGLCQFMPSNISSYAVDGNGDGKIDLFALEDAVPSAANFLKEHGWRKDTAGQRRVRLLKYYNHSTAYANTILGLSEGVSGLDKAEAKKRAASAKAAAQPPKPATAGKS